MRLHLSKLIKCLHSRRHFRQKTRYNTATHTNLTVSRPK